jgi:hypothetical protein
LEICACIVGTSQFAVSEELNKPEIPAYSPERMAREFEILEALRNQYVAAINSKNEAEAKRLGNEMYAQLAKMTAMTQKHFRLTSSFPP